MAKNEKVWYMFVGWIMLFDLGSQTSSATRSFQEAPPPDCLQQPLSAHQTEWQTQVGGSLVSVEWGYGNTTCSSTATCHGIKTEPDTELEPQLFPVHLQQGVRLRFFSSPEMSVPLQFRPFRVDEAGFHACDTSRGQPVSQDYISGDIYVSSRFLQPGFNYFIANTTDPLYECKFGLRLNVTVKTALCAGPGQNVACWKRGRCVTDVYSSMYHCECCKGWAGKYCEDVNVCSSESCKNGGFCTDLHQDSKGKKFACTCPAGFYGDTCEKYVENLCSENVCVNNATCLPNGSSYECVCSHGYTGHLCEVDINECSTRPCIHGVCVDQVGGYLCYCTPGYGGINCDKQYNECQSNPCKNGGFCVDKIDNFRCECERGFTGHDCSVKVDLCDKGYCKNATECIDYGRTFGCTCNPGYDGSHCEINVNECESNPCLNGGKCFDKTAGYRCYCLHGFNGLHCEYSFSGPPDKKKVVSYSSHMHHDHITNLYIIAGTLGGALLIALGVLLFCYCRINKTYRAICCRNQGYQRHKEDRTRSRRRRPVDLPATIDAGPSAEAIVATTSSDYRDNAPLVKSLRPKRI